MSAFDTTPLTSREASHAVQFGQVTALFQPIEALQTGLCCGFEALARLPQRGRDLTPDLFLPQLAADDRLCLFGTMLGHAISFLKAQQAAGHHFYVALNVEVSLVMSEDFVDILQYFLERYAFSGEQLVLEILENEDVTDLLRLRARLFAIRTLGITFALDDIGAGYASLQKMMQLPIDVFKLDRGFCRDIEREPEHLLFVMSVLMLARGLRKQMIVEGIETPEVYDALRILGVEHGQGYHIARPMPAEAVGAWLAGRAPREPSRVPTCLFGAYASHLTVVENCRTLRTQPLPMTWTDAASDHCTCPIGRLSGRAIGTIRRSGGHTRPFMPRFPPSSRTKQPMNKPSGRSRTRWSGRWSTARRRSAASLSPSASLAEARRHHERRAGLKLWPEPRQPPIFATRASDTSKLA